MKAVIRPATSGDVVLQWLAPACAWEGTGALQAVLCSPASVDPEFFSSHPGVAVAVVAGDGGKVGSVAAYLEQPGQAVIYERWVTGPLQCWRLAFDNLLGELRRLNVRVVRAGTTRPVLRNWYERELGMSVWRELVRYERNLGGSHHSHDPRRGPAAIRLAVLERDRGALEAIWRAEPDHPSITALEDLARLFPARFAVADLHGAVCGYCFSYVENGVGCLKSVIVAPAKRGRGIGRQLVADAVAWFDELRVPSFLNTEVGNPVTHGLYTSFGYRRAGSFVVLERSL